RQDCEDAMNALLLMVVSALPGQADEPAPDAIKSAVAGGLKRIQEGAANYPNHRKCFSCHHQAVPVMALAAAKERGFDVSADNLKKHVDFSLKSFDKLDAIKKGQSVGGANTTAAYAMATFAVVDHPDVVTTQRLVWF